MNCPDCEKRLFEYNDPSTGFLEKICWNCGYYDSNSPAFLECPELLKNVVRNNPYSFMKKYGTYQPIGNTNNNSRQDNSTFEIKH